MNAWEQVEWIAAEALNYMRDALVITQLTAKDKTADFNVKPNGYAVGSSVDIRTNPVYEANEFTSTISTQGIRSSTRPMAIEKHFDVSVAMTAKEKRLDMDNFSEQVIKPAAYAIAEKCDRYIGTKLLEAAGMYASDNLFTTAADMALAKKAATFQQLAPTGRFCLVDDSLEAQLLGADFFATHNLRGTSGERVFNEGSMGRAMGMDFFSSLNFPGGSHTTGNGASTTNNTGSTNLVGLKVLTVDATTGTFQAGDRIQIAGVRRPLKVAAQATAGATTITLVDPITEIIPDGAAVTVIGSAATSVTWQGVIFDEASMAWASPALDPASDKPSAVVSDSGYSMRVVQGYDMNNKTETISIDMLAGATAYDPRRMTLLASY